VGIAGYSACVCTAVVYKCELSRSLGFTASELIGRSLTFLIGRGYNTNIECLVICRCDYYFMSLLMLLCEG
jgi:hypothetical protein